MTKFLWVILFALYWSKSSLGALHEILYNEDDLVNTCTYTCDTLPDRTNMFGCERISSCTFNRYGWHRGIVHCDWCSCQCRTSDDLPEQVVFDESEIIKGEAALFGTCTGKCHAPGLQFTNRFDCDEIRDCHLQRKGHFLGFIRCDHCECTCVTKVYPDSYRLENIDYHTDAIDVQQKDQVVVGSTTLENNENFEVTFSRSIAISFATERRWDLSQTHGTSISIGTSVGIDVKIFDFSAQKALTASYDYTTSWGETKTTTVTDTITQTINVPPHTVTEARVRGWTYSGSVPYTADLVTIYDNGEESRKRINGVLHEVSVTDFHASVGSNSDVSVKRDSLII